ncbi:MAG TPA: dihydrodipicolinate synthase family protein [Bryobacteraceae bacterium]|nr:dihydrodipicolinate synthase family protein [Bryobacteraceae bacterium]
MTAKYTRRELLTAAGSAALLSRFPALAAPSTSTPAKTLQGVFIILSTPYTADKDVDWGDLAYEVAMMDRFGVQGIVWPQLSSELPQLTKQERVQGMVVLSKAHQGKRSALVLGVQGDDTDEMMEYAEHAEKLEPDALIAIPPKKAKSMDDYRDYFSALCRMTKRPVFIQTSGGAPNLAPSIDLMVSLAHAFPNFGYVKEEHDPVIPRMKQLIAHRPDPIKRVYGAHFGNGLLYEMRLDTDGVITGGAMYGDIYAKLWDLHQQKKAEEARDLYAKLLLMLNLDQDIPGTRLYLLKKREIFKTTVSRQHEYKLTPDEIAEIDYRFDALTPYLKQ